MRLNRQIVWKQKYLITKQPNDKLKLLLIGRRNPASQTMWTLSHTLAMSLADMSMCDTTGLFVCVCVCVCVCTPNVYLSSNGKKKQNKTKQKKGKQSGKFDQTDLLKDVGGRWAAAAVQLNIYI